VSDLLAELQAWLGQRAISWTYQVEKADEPAKSILRARREEAMVIGQQVARLIKRAEEGR